MNLGKFYEECAGFAQVNGTEIYKYISEFSTVIIWGGSFLGKAVSKKLLADGVRIDKFWDVRYEELKSIHGIEVEAPYSEGYDKENTLIIFCIGYHAIMNYLLLQLERNGYHNVVRGDYIYSGLICQCNEHTELCADTCWSSQECRPLLCRKLLNIIQHQTAERETKEGPRIDYAFNTIIINTVCNLNCEYCLQYINSYPPEKRSNVPYEEIARDIDLYFDAVDSVGTVTIMGGEPFLHPDLGKIVHKLGEKKNIALISIATNGLIPLKESQLEGFGDPRVSINISNYEDVASEEQLKIRDQNIELLKKHNIAYTKGLPLPTWVIPPRMQKDDNETEMDLKNKKARCYMPPRDFQLKGGKLHVCDMSLAIHNMGRVDFPEDYIDLTKQWSREELRKAIRELDEKEFYSSCVYCRKFGTEDAGSGGRQGTRDISE